jgi:8-oxo-dGTP diphosphatase
MMPLAEEINYCPHCGNPVVWAFRFGKERPICPGCDWVYFPDPKVAVAVLITRDEKILLARRNIDPQRGFWSLPAGFVDAGEDPVEAATRECLEETGLDVQVTELLDVMAGREHARGADILIVYKAEIIGGKLRAGDDADRVGFFSPEEPPPLAFSTTKKLLARFC